MKKVIDNLDVLKVLSKANKKLRCAIIRNGNCDLINALVECVVNVLHGNVNLSEQDRKNLAKFRFQLRKLAKTVNLNDRKKLIVQYGGFLQFILPAIISGIASIVSSAISSNKSE